MSDFKKAKKELEKRQTVLERLTTEKNVLFKNIESLESERSTTVKLLAGGDEKQRKIINDLEEKLCPLKLRLEGLTGLISEAQWAVDEAQALFTQEQSQEAEELKSFIAKREREEHARLLAGLPERKQKLLDLYTEFCQMLGDFQVDSISLLDGRQDQVKEIADFQMGLTYRLAEAVKQKNLRPLMRAGYAGTISFWSLIQPGPEFPGTGLLNAGEVANIQRQKQLERFRTEFFESHS